MAEKKAVLEKDIPAGAGTNEKNLKTEKAEAVEKIQGIEKIENKFTKEQLLASKRFCARRDIVAALLRDGEQYTVRVVEQKINDYMKGEVK